MFFPVFFAVFFTSPFAPDFERSCTSWQRCQPLCTPSQTRRPPGCRTCAAPPSHCSPSGYSPAPSHSPPVRCRQCHRQPGLLAASTRVP